MGSLVQIDSPRLSKSRQDDTAAIRAERKARWKQVRPTSAHVTVENRCHLKCDHCYETEDTHSGEHAYALSVEDYERVFDELATLGVLHLTISGGEIFLRKDIFEIIEAARRRRFAVTLFTSGTPITAAKADRLAELLVHEVEVTIYSHDPEVHDAFTGTRGSHAKSVRALRLLNERGVRTVMKSNVMTFNVDHLDDLIGLAESVGADYQFDPTVKPKMNGDKSPLKYVVPADKIRRLVYSRPELYQAFANREPEAYCTGKGSLLAKDALMCAAGRSTVSIGADGGVYACNFFPVPAGNLSEGSLEDIWFGADQLDAIRKTTFDKMNECSSCELNSTCVPCMAYAEAEHGDHRACSTPAKQSAEQVRALAESRVRSNKKMERGAALPLVGDTIAPRPPPKPGAAGLSTE